MTQQLLDLPGAPEVGVADAVPVCDAVPADDAPDAGVEAPPPVPAGAPEVAVADAVPVCDAVPELAGVCGLEEGLPKSTLIPALLIASICS